MRNCERNAGFISLHDLPEEVFVAGAIIVTIDEHGHYGTRFVSEDIDELPPADVQLDLGVSIATAWQAAALAPKEQP